MRSLGVTHLLEAMIGLAIGGALLGPWLAAAAGAPAWPWFVLTGGGAIVLVAARWIGTSGRNEIALALVAASIMAGVVWLAILAHAGASFSGASGLGLLVLVQLLAGSWLRTRWVVLLTAAGSSAAVAIALWTPFFLLQDPVFRAMLGTILASGLLITVEGRTRASAVAQAEHGRRQVERTAQTLQSALAGIPEPVLLLRGSLIVSTNPAAASLELIQAAELPAQLDELLPATLVQACLGDSPSMRTRQHLERVGPSGRVNRIVVDVRSEPIERVSEFDRVVVLRDITDLARQEEALHKRTVELQRAQLHEATGQLAGGVAHDFNNLLGVIIGSAELLQLEESVDDAQKEPLEDIIEAASRGANLARQLLSFSRSTTDAEVVQDASDALRRLEPLLVRTIDDNVHLRMEVENDLPSPGLSNSQLDQLVLNLVVNARDAIAEAEHPYGTIAVGVTASQAPSGSVLRLVVEDDGIGMDEATVERVFEPLFTTKPEGRGTGLGLSTVRRLVESVEGQIEVQSRPQQGTTFTVLLPATNGRRASAAAHQQHAVMPTWSNVTALLIEDEVSLQRVATLVLDRLGVATIPVHSCAEALRTARQMEGKPDLILSDVFLEDGTGPDVAVQLRLMWPDTPVVFMSGSGLEEFDRHKIDLDRESLLAKPFTIESMRQCLEGALGVPVAAELDSGPMFQVS